MKDRRICLHCQRRVVTRPRGLCIPCFDAPGVRDQYPCEFKFGRRSPVPTLSQGPPPKMPTDAPAGSAEKMRVMAERAERGECLFHPRDSRAMVERPPMERGCHRAV